MYCDILMSSRSLHIGLFASDPNSFRARSLETAITDLGMRSSQVFPWLITRHIHGSSLSLTMGNIDLSTLDAIYLVDLGADDLGSFYNRMGILSTLSQLGVMIINPVDSVLTMRDKAHTIQQLAQAGLRVPETLITESIQEAREFIRKNAPCVLKPVTGFGGIGVKLISTPFDVEHCSDYLKYHNLIYGKGAYLLQQFIRSPGFDIRALVVNGQVIATMKRVITQGILANIHAGGVPTKNDIVVDDIALAAARAVRGKIVGVDIIPDQSGELWVLEVNSTPGWTGLQSVTDFNIATRIAQSLITMIRK